MPVTKVVPKAYVLEAYVLERGSERIEVLVGREERRDQLMGVGYEWVNQDLFPVDKTLEKKSKEG